MPRFVPRERKHRKIARVQKASDTTTTTNSNPQEIVPETTTEREVRRAHLQKQLRDAQPASKVTSKKRKRLDKYIETKLKKDENAALLKKLEAQRIDTSLFQSSKKLGRVTESKREKLQRALQAREAGLNIADESILFEPRREVGNVSDEEVAEQRASRAREAGLNIADESTLFEPRRAVGNVSDEKVVTPAFGAGLKRPLDLGEDGRPVMQKRKRRRKNAHQPGLQFDNVSGNDLSGNDRSQDEATSDSDAGVDVEEEWQGFSDDEVATLAATNGHANGTSKLQITKRPWDARDFADHSSAEESDSASVSSSTSSSSAPWQGGKRVSAFKAWADSVRNAALDFKPSATATTTNDEAMKVAAANFKPRATSPEPLLNATPTGTESTRPAISVTVSRAEEIQQARMQLPVLQEEQKIMETIHSHPVVVICGATGSGKTTQVPQMLFESGYTGSSSVDAVSTSPSPKRGMIGVTQPRRVAATSVATRVSYEMGPEYGKRVAHQVRYDTSVKQDTAIKFMTDGILLREIQRDFILSKYSVIVIDEAHERSVNTDLLIGMLSRIVPLRADLAKKEPNKHYPLKLVIMSATLSHGTDSFLKNDKLWAHVGGPPPIVEAEGRQYPVTVHFSRRTRRDYVSEIVEKVAKGHRKLPPGGMLVFLTGQQEIMAVAKKLKDRLGGPNSAIAPANSSNGRTGELDDYEDDIDPRSRSDFLEGEEEGSDSEAEIDVGDDDEFAIQDVEPQRIETNGHRTPLKPYILPLYAALPATQQLKVFNAPPDGHRAIILATNVAETSLTIPGTRYVFDSGRVKEKRYDTSTGVQTFEVDWVSKASAEQRKGRAGRTGPGHVWRLYSSAVYEEYLAEETVPEILRSPLEGTILQLKAMEIEKVKDFPFPTAPMQHQLGIAERLLVNLGAIDANLGSVTGTGNQLIRFPVSPRFGKMLVLAEKNQILRKVVALVAGLAVGDLIIPEVQLQGSNQDIEIDRRSDDSDGSQTNRREQRAAQVASQQQHSSYNRGQATLSRWDDRSDAVKILTAVAIHSDAQQSGPHGTGAGAVCQQFSLREKAMNEVHMLRRQLHNLVGENVSDLQLPVPSDKEPAMLNQIVLAGFIDQVAIRTDMLKDTTGFGLNPRRAIEVAYRTLIPSFDPADLRNGTTTPEEAEILKNVFVHPSSVLAKLSVHEMPQYIVYSHLSRAAPSTVTAGNVSKTRMHPLTAVGPKALALLAEGTPLLQIGKPVGMRIEDLPRSENGRQRRQCWVSVALGAPGGAVADQWPLGAWKVIQRRGARDWEVEKVLAR